MNKLPRRAHGNGFCLRHTNGPWYGHKECFSSDYRLAYGQSLLFWYTDGERVTTAKA
jgi:hypothetical protein